MIGAILGISLAVSVTGNVIQGIQNRKLRKQIEQLTKINQELQVRNDELLKQYKALKLFSFKQKFELIKEMSANKAEVKKNEQQINELLEKAKK